MEEDSYNFATTILTSKSPQQAAAILPSIITGSTGLNKDLVSWFNNYNTAIGAHNASLKQLLEEAKKIAGRSSVGFNNFPRNWNCLVNAVQMELKDNEILQENLKQDVIIPLKNLIENDVRISELTVNGQELTELSQHLTKEGEYQWNFKAPQAFQNLEAFKKIEIQLMFNVILNYFQLNSARLNKEVKNNENSTNYLLGSFKLDNEMKSQLDYMQNTQFHLPQQNARQNRAEVTSSGAGHVAGSSTTPSKERRRSSLGRLDKHAGAHDENSPKKSSKLKSRVGSIFGRKKKKDQHQPQLESTIAEDASISTDASTSRSAPLSRNNTSRSFLSREQRYDSPAADQRRPSQAGQLQHQQEQPQTPFPPLKPQQPQEIHKQPQQPQQPQQLQQLQQPQQPQQFQQLQQQQEFGSGATSQQFPPPQQQRSNVSSQPFAAPRHSSFASLQQQDSYKDAALPATPTHDRAWTKPLPQPTESPNVVKYGSDDDDDDDSEDNVTAGRRSSLLERHHLDTGNQADVRASGFAAPQLQSSNVGSGLLDPNERARQNSDGKYSFEAGDDNKPISATPRSEQNGFNEGDRISDSIASAEGRRGIDNKDFDAISSRDDESSKLAGESGVATTSPNRDAFAPHSYPSSNTTSSLTGFGGAAPPKPPPSRKVVHHDAGSVRDSHMFHNLPAATTNSSIRDSFVQPPRPSSRNSHLNNPFAALKRQDTGSLLNNDFKHFNLSDATIGLNSSIAEIVNATFKDGQLKSSQVIGEVAFNYNGHPNEESIIVHIPHDYDRLIVNKTFIEELGDYDYKLDPISIGSKTLGGLKYLANDNQVPLLVQQIWKFEPHQSSLMISIRSNVNETLEVENLIVSAALNTDVVATSASSKPQGAFNKEKNRITWRYNHPVVLKPHGEEKLIARFMTNGQGSEHELGVQLKFAIGNPSAIKYCSIYDSQGEEVPVFRNLVSGHYASHFE